IHIDVAILGFAVACALVTSLLFGLAPILHTRVDELGAVLKEGQRTVTGARQRFRRALVVSEVALAVVLVIGCGLVIKSFVRLAQVDTGLPRRARPPRGPEPRPEATRARGTRRLPG